MIELADMVRELRDQLNCALAGAGTGPIRFELGPVEIEATVAIDRAGGAAGKVNFWVVEANSDVSVASNRTHRVTLTLQPTLVTPDGTHRHVLISGDEADGER
ncbi:trypco2 family protein [Streptomyces sp. NPDC017890]|uniref:trypco2 family protein n=1 Tax=Streptomyces sp. NPDC017890 TaxID=3365015 RepID=UPI003789CC3D